MGVTKKKDLERTAKRVEIYHSRHGKGKLFDHQGLSTITGKSEHPKGGRDFDHGGNYSQKPIQNYDTQEIIPCSSPVRKPKTKRSFSRKGVDPVNGRKQTQEKGRRREAHIREQARFRGRGCVRLIRQVRAEKLSILRNG